MPAGGPGKVGSYPRGPYGQDLFGEAGKRCGEKVETKPLKGKSR